jgi:hypothetical protein
MFPVSSCRLIRKSCIPHTHSTFAGFFPAFYLLRSITTYSAFDSSINSFIFALISSRKPACIASPLWDSITE